MTDLRKAAEMALDALRLYVTMYPQMDKGYMVDARETLRQALAQPEPVACGYDETVGLCTNNPCCEQAQPVQESKPITFMGQYVGEGKVVSASFGLPKGAFEFAPHTGKGEASKIKHSLEPMLEQEPTACGYDETVGMCTNNPCCEQTPVSQLWECIGRWSSYLALNGEKANLAPPEWLVAAVKAATAQPEFDTPESHVVKWSIPVDPNNFGEALAQPEPQVCCGDYEKCMKACTPRGRWLANQQITRLKQEKGQFIGGIPEVSQQREWVGLTDDEVDLILWQGVFDAKDIRAIETKLKEKNGGS